MSIEDAKMLAISVLLLTLLIKKNFLVIFKELLYEAK